MTTNEIEKQLRLKSRKQIKSFADETLHNFRQFARKNTDYNRSGMNWYHKGVKPHPTKSISQDDPWNHLDWAEVGDLIVRNLEENWLDDMVEKQAKELLSKIDLLA